MSDGRGGGDRRDAFGRPVTDGPDPRAAGDPPGPPGPGPTPRRSDPTAPPHGPAAPGAAPRPRRSGGWAVAVLGLVVLVAGIVLLVGGISEAVRSHDRIEDDAVGRGTVRRTSAPTPAAFVVPAGERRDYTVYLRTGGGGTDGDDPVVAATTCVATLPNDARTRFSGARQTVSVTLGSLASVGSFSSPPGPVAVRCVLGSARFGDDAAEFVVTPGRPSVTGSGILAIIGGVLAILLGIAVTGAGIVRAVVRR